MSTNHLLDRMLRRAGLVRLSALNDVLSSEAGLEKRIDEHREMAEAVATKTTLLRDWPWHVFHLESQDRYLLGLRQLVKNDVAVTESCVRSWPLPVNK